MSDDVYEPQSNLDYLAELLKRIGRPFTFYQYPDAGHWFFDPDRLEAYHRVAADLAWERRLTFLKREGTG